jgi:tRNA(Arg) A34 adenosine deaminase TadA
MKQEFMREAIRLSREGMERGDGGPFGCVIVRDDVIISSGNNQVTSSNDPTAHAEVVAIREACHRLGTFQLDGCEIYSSCEPCPMCLGAIYWARPSKIYYACTREDAAAIGFDDQFLYEELVTDPAHRRIPIQQLMHDEAMEVFEVWRNKEDKIRY